MTGMVYQRVQKTAAWNPRHDTQIKKQHPKIQPKSASSSGLSAQERIDSLPDVPANWMSLDPVMRRIQAKAAAMQLAASQEDESQKTGDSPVLDADAVQMKCSQCEEKVQLHADGETQLFADDSHEQVQLHTNGHNGAKSIQQLAAEGFSGSATTLPHLNQIQQSFGVNLSHVQAYIGGGAAAACNQMGAAAYASGNQIAFKEAPSVELAAHEAAHVVQQQSGKVQLSGGVGQVGDKYEQHADDVAARVGAGQSAGDLLAEYNEDNFPKRVYDIYQQKTENEFKEKRNEDKSLDKSSSDTSYSENIECNSKVEIPLEFVDTKSSENSISEKLNQNENLTPESRTKSMRKGSGAILTLYCARARQNTFVYGSIKSYFNPIYAWFIETAFSDGKTFSTTNTTFPTLYVKLDFQYERPLSWAQILTAQAEGLFGTMRMTGGVPLETSCPSSRDDEGGAK